MRGRPQKGDRVIVLDLRSTTGTEPLDEALRPKGRLRKRVYWPAEMPVPDALSAYESRGEFEVRGERKGNLVLWRDFTKDERLKMGEILDARYNIAKTYSLMARDLATGRFFDDIAKNEEWSRKAPPDGAAVEEDADKAQSWASRMWRDLSVEWVRVPETKIPKSDTFKYGALAGRYVRADIWADMMEIRALQAPNWWQRLLTMWKVNKTARSPVVHMNNVVSNLVLMDLADVRMPDLVAGIRSLARGDASYREALEHGALGGDIVTHEFRDDVLRPLLEEMEQEMKGRARQDYASATRILGKAMDRLARYAKRADKAMVDAYQMEDRIFRMATYMRRRGQGFSIEEAADEARAQFLDYDIHAPWVNAARRSVLPFISYTYRAVPRVAQTVAYRPWKVAKLFLLYEGLNALSYSLAPSEWDEDEERKSLRENEQGYTWVGVERMVRMPYLSDGNPVFLDVRRWVPAGDVFDTGGSDVVPAPLHPSGPLMLAGELWFNRSLFTGDEIYDEIVDTVPERAGKAAGHLYRSWMPGSPWIPGSWYWEKIGRAYRGEALEWGSNEPYDLGEAVASSAGIKLKPKDVRIGYLGWKIEYDRREQALRAAMSSLRRQRQRRLIGEAAFAKETDRLRTKLGRLQEERRERFPRR